MGIRNHTPELSFLLQELMRPFSAACLITQDGQILGSKFSTLTDIGTFAPFVESISKYFSLTEGDLVVCNDSNTGNPLLNVISIVTPFIIKTDGVDQKYYFACRTRLKPNILGTELLKIPPTPIATGKVWNDGILGILSTHPQVPVGLIETIKKMAEQAWSQGANLKSWTASRPQCFSKASQKAWLQESKERILHKINEVARGEHRMEVQFPTGEIIRLHTEIKSDEIHFDFAGTSSSKNLFIMDTVTVGVCLGATLAFIGESELINSGAFSLVTVTTPQGCLLSAPKNSTPSFQGSVEVCLVLGTCVLQTLSAIAPTKSVGAHRSIPTILDFEFADQKSYFEVVAGGTGANSDGNGLDAFYYWSLSNQRRSIEEIESKHPVLVRQHGLRKGSGGSGRTTGGNGSVHEVELLADCKLKWLQGFKNFQVKGVKVSDTGKPAEILIVNKKGEKTILSERLGEISLKAGDKVFTSSAGGSGFGKAEPK